jgi:hypothetical protein
VVLAPLVGGGAVLGGAVLAADLVYKGAGAATEGV